MSKSLKFIFNLPLVFLGGILGAIGGSENSSKLWRRIGMPLLLTSSAFFHLHSLWLLSIMVMVIVFFIGYGIPDIGDKGSFLGRFWAKIFNYNPEIPSEITNKKNRLVNVCTRGTIGLLIALSTISIPIINKNWLIYGLCSLGIILSYSFLSWRNFGSIKFRNKELCKSDLINYSIITGLVLLVIYF